MDGSSSSSGQGEPFLGPDDWRINLQPDARRRIVDRILDALKRYLPMSIPDGLNELEKIATQFEEEIYFAAANQSDYLNKISLKMLSVENKFQHFATIPNNTVIIQNSLGPGLELVQSSLLLRSRLHPLRRPPPVNL